MGECTQFIWKWRPLHITHMEGRTGGIAWALLGKFQEKGGFGENTPCTSASRSRSPRRATWPAAQQQQHSSSVGAMRPASSKPAQMFRTPKGRSREGRSPRAKPLGQFRSPTMPRALVQQAHCWLCKQASIEFVKQTKHDERVAPDHEHHDRADHDEHGTRASRQSRPRRTRHQYKPAGSLVRVDWHIICATFAASRKAGGRQAHGVQL